MVKYQCDGNGLVFTEIVNSNIHLNKLKPLKDSNKMENKRNTKLLEQFQNTRKK